MKRLVIIAASVALLFPALSFAQPSGNRPPPPGNSNNPPNNDQGQSRPPNRPGNPPGRPGNGPNRPPPRPNRPQFSWHGRFFSPVRRPAFHYPRGYAYRRWSIGAFLPPLFLASAYYYNDWQTLGIDPPPPGRRWVRYGPDLLLVNIGTRRIEDVIYGAFY